MRHVATIRFLKELRRRRVFRTAGLYVIGAWLLLQAANILFPGWGVPPEAIRFLFLAVLLGFPVALVFGWTFDITPDGIRRTGPLSPEAERLESLPLKRTDFLILTAFVVVIGLIAYDATTRVLRTAVLEEPPVPVAELAEIIENSVAVLPFANLSPDPEHEYFADGISEEILNRLSAFDALKVIARTSSFSFKDSGYDIARISGLLGVEYLLQGSVRRDDGQLRISAQLLDHNGVQMWTQTFDREFGAIFALQEEIAEAVATRIVPEITSPPAEGREPDLAAYEAYLAGREIQAGRGSMIRALEFFDRAIELDPDFAEAYAERAVTRALIGHPPEVLDRAQDDIDRALALEPDLARAHAAQGLMMRVPGVGDAEQEVVLRRALALNPNQVDTLNWLAGALRDQGRHAEADEVLRRAHRLDPLSPVINANLAMREAAYGAFAEAEQRLLRAREAPRPSHLIDRTLIGMYQGTGRIVEAIELNKRYVLEAIGEVGRLDAARDPLDAIGLYARLGITDMAEYWRGLTSRATPDLPGAADLMSFRWFSYEGTMDYRKALQKFEETVQAEGGDLAEAPLVFRLTPGNLLALSGDYNEAIRELEPLLGAFGADTGRSANKRLSLAWAYLQTDNRAQAAEVLEPLEQYFHARQADDRLHGSFVLADFALTMLLSGDPERALDLLEQAAEAGWRRYYEAQRDPRWDAVRDHPRFVEIMDRVKADIDQQRARMEAIDAEDDFIERVEQLLAEHADEAAVETPP